MADPISDAVKRMLSEASSGSSGSSGSGNQSSGSQSGSSGSQSGGENSSSSARPDAYLARELPIEREQQNSVELQSPERSPREVAEDRARNLGLAFGLTPEKLVEFVNDVGVKSTSVGATAALNIDEVMNSLQKVTALPPFLIEARLAMTGAREIGITGGFDPGERSLGVMSMPLANVALEQQVSDLAVGGVR